MAISEKPRALASRSWVPILGVMLLLGQVTAAASTNAGRPAWCRPTGNLRAQEMPQRAKASDCPMQGRVIEDYGDVASVVPQPGGSVYAETINLDGVGQLLNVATEADGTVVLGYVGADDVHEEGHDSADDEMQMASHSASPGPCQDTAYGHNNSRDTNQHTWYFRSSTTPSNLTVSNTANELLAGYNAITNAHNDCGLPDQIDGASQLYGGNTTSGGNFTSTGACGTPDGLYVVDFGNVGSNVGRMCSWGTTTPGGWVEVSSADIKLSSSVSWFTGSVPVGCSNRWSVKTITAHEAGHAFGMGHVGFTTHGYLTMAESGHPCADYQYTLGKGDIDGLNVLY